MRRQLAHSLDVLLAAYCGLSLPPSWMFTQWWWRRVGGLAGLQQQLSSDGASVLVGGALFAFAVLHLVLPLPALLTSLGLRMRAPWARGLGLGLGVLLLLLAPVGTLLGLVLLFSLLDQDVAAEFAGSEPSGGPGRAGSEVESG